MLSSLTVTGMMKGFIKLLREGIRIIGLYRNWPEILSNHFRSDKDTTELVLRNGISYKIHPKSTDMGVIQEIHNENVYQIQRDDIRNNSVVIDIGAHIGVFSVFAAVQAENVTVYSFEPEPGNFELLVRNIAANNLESRIHPINLAVSNIDIPRKLIRSATSVSAHSFSANKFLDDDVKDSLAVNCTTLSDIFRKYEINKCDILKLDCEGEEYNILLNASDEILAKIVKIVGEYHDGLNQYTHDDLGNFLSERDFEVEMKGLGSFPTFTVGFLYAFNKSTK